MTDKRRSCLFVALLFLATAFLSLYLVIPASAAETSLLVLPEETATYISKAGLTKVDTFFSSMREWNGLSGSTLSFYGLTALENAMIVQPGTSGIAGARRVLKTPLTTSGKTEFLLSLQYTSDSDGSITVVLETASGAFISEGTLPAGESAMVLVDLSPLKGKAITAFSVSVTNDSQAFEGFRLFSINMGGEDRFRMVADYTSPALSIKGATYEWREDGLRITAAENTCSVSAYVVSTDVGKGFFHISLTAEKSGMSLYLTTDEGLRSGGIALKEGTHTYLFALSLTEPLSSYELTFSGTAGESISLHAVRFFFYDESPNEEESIGSVTACRLSADAKSLTVSGKLSSSAVITYMDGSVAVFETDENGRFDQSRPLAVTGISTRFTFTLDVTTLSFITSRYQLAVIAEDGSVIPFDEPRFAVGTEGDGGNGSVVGLSGAEEADTFSANASHVIVDVFLDRLLSTTAGGRLCSWNNAHYYLDSDYLDDLDQEILFYTATGMDIYLRFLSGTDLSEIHLTLPSQDLNARYYALDGSSPEGENLLSAMTNFLTERYTALAGIILGYRLDDSRLHAGDAEDILAFIDNYVRTARLIYHIAIRNGHTDILLYVPMGNGEGEDRENALLLTALLQNRFQEGGTIPLGLLYCAKGSGRIYEETAFFYSRLKLAAPTPQKLACLILPPPENGTKANVILFEDLCLRAREASCSIVFFDASGIRSHAFYDGLKELLIDENRGTEVFSPLKETPVLSGSYALWDFVDSYDAMHWIAGGSFSQPLTASSRQIAEYLSLSSARTLTASMDGNDHGILLCTPADKLDLSAAPFVSFTLLYTGEAETASVTLIFGSGDLYAEFTTDLTSGTVTDVVCDLSAYSGITAVNVVAIEVSESTARLDLARVTLGSTELTDEELKTRFAEDSTPEDTPEDRSPILFGVVFLAVIVSLVLFLLISKRKTDSHSK